MREALFLGLSILLTGCASQGLRASAAPMPEVTPTADSLGAGASRLGPPSPGGASLRRVDRPAAALPPLALR